MAKAEKIVTAAAAAFKPGKGVSVTAKGLKGAGESKVELPKTKGAASSVATKPSAVKVAAATASAASISKVEDLVAPGTPPIGGISDAAREAGEAAEWAAAAKPVLYNKWDEAP
jgi:hypothetical protein